MQTSDSESDPQTSTLEEKQEPPTSAFLAENTKPTPEEKQRTNLLLNAAKKKTSDHSQTDVDATLMQESATDLKGSFGLEHPKSKAPSVPIAKKEIGPPTAPRTWDGQLNYFITTQIDGTPSSMPVQQPQLINAISRRGVGMDGSHSSESKTSEKTKEPIPVAKHSYTVDFVKNANNARGRVLQFDWHYGKGKNGPIPPSRFGKVVHVVGQMKKKGNPLGPPMTFYGRSNGIVRFLNEIKVYHRETPFDVIDFAVPLDAFNFSSNDNQSIELEGGRRSSSVWATVTLLPLNSNQYPTDEIEDIENWDGASFGLNASGKQYTSLSELCLMSEAMFAQSEVAYDQYELKWEGEKIINANPHQEKSVFDGKHGLSKAIETAVDNPPENVSRMDAFPEGTQSLTQKIDEDHNSNYYGRYPLDKNEKKMRQRGELNSGTTTKDLYKELRYFVMRADPMSLDYKKGLDNIIDLLCNPILSGLSGLVVLSIIFFMLRFSTGEQQLARFIAFMYSSPDSGRYASIRSGGFMGMIVISHMFSVLHAKDETFLSRGENGNFQFIAGIVLDRLHVTLIESLGQFSEAILYGYSLATCGIEILLNQCKVNRNLQFGLDMSRQIVQRRYVPSVGRRFHDLMQRTQREGDIEVWGIEKSGNWFFLNRRFHNVGDGNKQVRVLKCLQEEPLLEILRAHNAEIDDIFATTIFFNFKNKYLLGDWMRHNLIQGMGSAYDEITHHGQIHTLDRMKAFLVAAPSRINARTVQKKYQETKR